MSEPKSNSKKEYVKPEMLMIDLAADEVMSVGCKTDTGVGGLDGNPPAPCLTLQCSSETGS